MLNLLSVVGFAYNMLTRKVTYIVRKIRTDYLCYSLNNVGGNNNLAKDRSQVLMLVKLLWSTKIQKCQDVGD